MRMIIVTILATVALCSSARAQVADSLYIVTYTAGPSWDTDKLPLSSFTSVSIQPD